MRNPDGSLVLGRTRWRRFALAVVPAVAAVGVLMYGIATGALPAQFTVSGQEFKVSADLLEGTDFVQVPGWHTTRDHPLTPENEATTLAVARSVIGHAELTNLCQSVRMPPIVNLLVPGDIVLRIEAGGGSTPAEADNLVIGLTELSGNAEFTNIQIGNDAGELADDPLLNTLPGQRADAIRVENLRQIGYSTQASSFTLSGLSLKVLVDDPNGECF